MHHEFLLPSRGRSGRPRPRRGTGRVSPWAGNRGRGCHRRQVGAPAGRCRSRSGDPAPVPSWHLVLAVRAWWV